MGQDSDTSVDERLLAPRITPADDLCMITFRPEWEAPLEALAMP
jgi:hypothetical protein